MIWKTQTLKTKPNKVEIWLELNPPIPEALLVKEKSIELKSGVLKEDQITNGKVEIIMSRNKVLKLCKLILYWLKKIIPNSKLTIPNPLNINSFKILTFSQRVSISL